MKHGAGQSVKAVLAKLPGHLSASFKVSHPIQLQSAQDSIVI